MAGDGETVRLVSHLLDQLQGQRIGSGLHLAAVRKYQGFFTGFAFRALGDADQAHGADVQRQQHVTRLRELALATMQGNTF